MFFFSKTIRFFGRIYLFISIYKFPSAIQQDRFYSTLGENHQSFPTKTDLWDFPCFHWAERTLPVGWICTCRVCRAAGNGPGCNLKRSWPPPGWTAWRWREVSGGRETSASGRNAAVRRKCSAATKIGLLVTHTLTEWHSRRSLQYL